MRRWTSIGRGAADAAPRVSRRSTAVLLTAVLSLSSSSVAAQSPERLEPLPGSQVTLRGRTSVGAWRCVIGRVSAVVDPAAADPLADLLVRLPVAGIRCGSRGMERDLRAALRSDRHPDIVVRSVRATSSSEGIVRVDATIEVAGVARMISTAVRVDASERVRVRIAGSIPLRMSDFDVEPPTAMMGLVRAHDGVVVDYDVLVAAPTVLRVMAAGDGLARVTP